MSGTQELQKVLDLFEQRIAAVESKVGVAGPPPPPATLEVVVAEQDIQQDRLQEDQQTVVQV